MVESQEFDIAQDYSQSSRLRDFEEKQKLLKDRVLLVGENLIDLRSEVTHEISSMKKELELLKDSMEKVEEAIKRVSEEIDGKARKEDLLILQKQAKIFDPLKFVTFDDLNNRSKSK